MTCGAEGPMILVEIFSEAHNPMKVLGDSPALSVLNTPLVSRPDPADATVESEAASRSASTAPARDGAEDFLVSNIWASAPPGARQLLTSAAAPQTAGSTSAMAAQAWVDHIATPVLPLGEMLGG